MKSFVALPLLFAFGRADMTLFLRGQFSVSFVDINLESSTLLRFIHYPAFNEASSLYISFYTVSDYLHQLLSI